MGSGARSRCTWRRPARRSRLCARSSDELEETAGHGTRSRRRRRRTQTSTSPSRPRSSEFAAHGPRRARRAVGPREQRRHTRSGRPASTRSTWASGAERSWSTSAAWPCASRSVRSADARTRAAGGSSTCRAPGSAAPGCNPTSRPTRRARPRSPCSPRPSPVSSPARSPSTPSRPEPQPTSFVERGRAGRPGAGRRRALPGDGAATSPPPTSLDGFFAIVDFLLAAESSWLTGKLLSARWDRVDDLREARARLENTSLLTLRRIDDTMFAEVTP